MRRLPVVMLAASVLVLLAASPALAQWAPVFEDVQAVDMTAKLRSWGIAVVGALAAVFTLVFIGSIIWTSKKLALSSTNPHARSEAMSGFIWIFVAGVAAFAASTIAGIAYWLSTR